MKLKALLKAGVLGVSTLAMASVAAAQDKTIRIVGFGAASGVVGIFGQNSSAAMSAAFEKINAEGGVELADGSKAMIETEYYDDRCNAEEGISVLRRIASTDALVAIGPTCSNVAEPLFGILQAKVDDEGDTGLQFPVFTDVAIKGGLAGISEWVFRNTPSESQMYDDLFAWLRTNHPDLKTIYGGVEEDFAHSRFTWYSVMKTAAEKHGFEVVGEAQWLLSDTNFSNQARGMRRAEPDVVAISAHPFTTCGMLREMTRQRIQPKILVGLTSSSSLETLSGCANEAEGLTIPTSFAPVNEEAKAAAEAVVAKGGQMDLHSASAWENAMILKDIIEAAEIGGTPETLEEDRRKIRDALAELENAPGLLGSNKRLPDGEAVKPYVFVHAKDGSWDVLHNPGS
ncbi:ABC transporter substrate-binding protein [Jannaschia seohaensis]|uniref:Branched-chain amino acid transport system substrate-binding protein n=1 Tax=Jannaschia seohaensis TaxID=475081 RepID=A0A2Y9B303_9RHOB|nr:ABC transporter substrate-binding protein [Jannaschia seohaensis]PWJ13832.1 branched-chain amino acid transport system substrate-binding protein [Jannaschia seohaensis]SSA50345.1 branched-chain amino acid transport system substrate-binding protein [Jannaschia seohaensis]